MDLMVCTTEQITMDIRSFFLLIAVGCISGCAAVDSRTVFNETEALVIERGVKKIHWRRGGDEDAKVDEEVKDLLSRELTAADAVQIALLNNRRLQATYESLSVAQSDLVAAGLLRNPVFDAEVRFAQAGGGTGLELAVVQNFIDIFFIPLRKRIAGAGLESAKFRVSSEILNLAAEVRKVFYTLQAGEQTLQMRRQVLSATEASYDLSKRLRAAKNITELDLAKERVLYEQSKLDLRQAELQVLRGREDLNNHLGLWGGATKWKIQGTLPDIPEDEVPFKGIERKAIEKSLQLAALRQDIEQAAASLGVVWPFAQFSDAGIGASSEREPEGDWATGPAFSIPLPLFNQGQPAITTAQAEFRRAAELFAAEAVTLRTRVRTAHAAVAAARDQALYYSNVLLPLRQQIVRQSQLQYNAMQIGPIQLLMAKEQQIEAGKRYILSLLDYWVLRTELDLLLNGGSGTVSEPSGGSIGEQESREARGGH